MPVGKKDKIKRSTLLAAAAYFKLGKITSYSLIRGGNINSNYILLSDQGKYILRVYKFKTKHEIISELQLLRYLTSNKFPCPEPIGGILRIEGKYICCFKYIEGKPLLQISNHVLEQVANLLAQLHILTKNYQPQYPREGEGLEVIKSYVKRKGRVISRSKFKNGTAFIAYLKFELDCLRQINNLPGGAIHVDIKPENIIINRKRRVNFIDFDNFYIDSFITDIANALMWLCVSKRERLDIQKARVFLKSYNSKKNLTIREEDYLFESIKLYCLKGAFKYAFICLPRLRFAEKWSYFFIRLYRNILNQENEIYEIFRKY